MFKKWYCKKCDKVLGYFTTRRVVEATGKYAFVYRECEKCGSSVDELKK